MKKKLVVDRNSLLKMVLPQPHHRLLFVYDDLMAQGVIAELCPDPTFITAAVLPDSQFFINVEGRASVRMKPGSFVYGCVWQIDEIGLIGLDISVGMPTFVERVGRFKRDLGGRHVVAEHFEAKETRPGKGNSSYVAQIVHAAAQYNFPEDYMTELQQWSS